MMRFPFRDTRVVRFRGSGPRGSGLLDPSCFSESTAWECESSYAGGGSNGAFKSDMVGAWDKAST